MKWIAFLVSMLLSCLAAAADKPATISGNIFGDYYYVAEHHDTSLERKNGFWIRRMNLTLDRDLGDRLSARLRFEARSPGDFRTNASLEPKVKDAYVKWNRSPKLDVVLGISPSPTWETIERSWGYRYVERTPLDLYRMGDSRDFGIALLGALDDAKRVSYHFMIGNGSGTDSETNAGKKVALAVDLAPTKETVFEINADREERPDDTDRTTLQMFAMLQRTRYRVGVQVARQKRGSDEVALASVFAVIRVRKNVSVLARVDRSFDPVSDADRISYLPMKTSSPWTLVIAGMDFQVHPHLNLIPNVEVVRYDDNDSDVLPRFTFYFTF